ncbi:pyruvate dehydrogenase E2 component (dihydrolipoamide acetyltransferase) [Marinobacter sp. es.048]|uniref:2-oxo acid dehydrogenase subunit E2 n=1 Tax=Marinobacter sp. es.048 TaxID=1761795 RepID=UPI000B58B941|nr:2-oxo acid dehydrogenase subunit E2 [Marinobacter sp. es.048]SNC62761.1 pyruvate dehydrogenase E2 component (dihydrolipoamide acetyltransferase) [Marinobacter sp. es.048]
MTQTKPFNFEFPPLPDMDFSEFGEVDQVPLPRIQKLTSAFLSRNWVTIPHVTHHDEADITKLEVLRKRMAGEGTRITPLAFQVKALVSALKAFPMFNASLDASGENLVLKKYFHIGIAIDTDKGLLVGVVRDCDRKTVSEIGKDIASLSERARTKGLPLKDMQGGCMTISALGGIGGTAFTPIINAPEVAILGVTRAYWKPFRAEDDGVDWRLVLPLDLSYDHRVINGADAARFLLHLSGQLANADALLTE